MADFLFIVVSVVVVVVDVIAVVAATERFYPEHPHAALEIFRALREKLKRNKSKNATKTEGKMKSKMFLVFEGVRRGRTVIDRLTTERNCNW